MYFETERSIVRSPQKKDAFDIFNNYTQDPDVTKYLIWKPHQRIEDSINWINYCIENAETNSSTYFQK